MFSVHTLPQPLPPFKPVGAGHFFHGFVRQYPRGCSSGNHTVAADGNADACDVGIGIFHIDGTSIGGIKNITANEPFFQGHFPNEPIMPGVLIVEAMAQCSGIYVMSKVDNPEEYSTYFLRTDGVRLKRKVVPGDTLQTEAHIIEPVRRGIASIIGKVFVGGQLACEATLMAQIVRNKKPE